MCCSASCLDVIHCRSKSHPRRSDLILNFPGAFRGFDGDSQLGGRSRGIEYARELHGQINAILAGKAHRDINTCSFTDIHGGYLCLIVYAIPKTLQKQRP